MINMATIKFGFTAKQIIKEGRVSEEQIETIKSWLLNENFPKLTDEQIVIFLNCNCNEIETTKKTIRAYYSERKSAPEVFDNRRTDRPGIEKIIKVVEICMLPQTREDGAAFICGRLYDTSYSNFDLTEALSLFTMILEIEVCNYPPKGMVVILDLNGMGLMHLTKLGFKTLKVLFQYLQEAMPARLIEFHVLNTVYFIEKLMAIIRPFMSQKLLDMFHFHPVGMDMELFQEQWVPKNCLPEDYEGDLPPVRVIYERNLQKLTEVQWFFEAEERQRHNIDQEVFNNNLKSEDTHL